MAHFYANNRVFYYWYFYFTTGLPGCVLKER